MEELHTLLLKKEVQSRKKNYDAIKEIQENSFKIITDIQEKTSEKCVVAEIAADYPFFQIHECIASLTFSHLYVMFKNRAAVFYQSIKT